MAPAVGRSAVLAVLLLPLTAAAAAGEGGAPLSAEHRAWLDEVAPLIGDDERAAFLALSADHLRSAFVDEFWRVRDPYPETPGNELRAQWEERADEARQRFDGEGDDRRRFFLLLGEPAAVIPGRCGTLLLPLEVWRYRGGEAAGAG
ncbi:MAG TPA: GWxTD domain-containing protein [Thermoanaerobaculia bacterium]|nr:GWxTD domain-containing protein [Thermoanaerobaculia bacterium]